MAKGNSKNERLAALENTIFAVSDVTPPNPPVFDSNIASNWKLFKLMWSDYEVLSEMEKKPQKFRVARLKHSLGDDGLRIYNRFQFDTEEDHRTVDQILKMFDSYVAGESNETCERYKFYSRDQKEGETFANFLASIKSLIETCNFCQNCVDVNLLDRIVRGIRDRGTRSVLLRKRNLTLKDAIDICKTEEQINSIC